MRILVDTSVWIHFLANRPPYRAALDALLEHRAVWGHDFIYGELLIGDKGGRHEVLMSYASIDHAPIVPHAEVSAFVRARRLHGRGIGWIDAHLLASALVSGARLWTADQPLAAVARDLGAHYDPD